MMATLTSTEFMKKPRNEPVLEYRPGSSERKQLEDVLKKYSGSTYEVPIVIGKEELQTNNVQYQLMVRLGIEF